MHPAQQLLFFQRRYCDMADARGGEMPVYRLLTCYSIDKNQYPLRLLEPLEGQITGDEIETTFSNDGSHLAFRKTGVGLFVIDFAQQQRSQITKNATDNTPRFSNNNSIIFLRKQVLMSVNIETGIEQVIYDTHPVLSFSISPNAQSVIFSALPEEKNFTLYLGE